VQTEDVKEDAKDENHEEVGPYGSSSARWWATGGVMAVAPSPAIAANTVSQATAQAVNLNLLQGALKVALSNPATSASNDGTQSNAQVHAQPIIDALSHQRLLEVVRLAETAEANQDGSSYGCAGIVGRGGQIRSVNTARPAPRSVPPTAGSRSTSARCRGPTPLGGLLSGLNGVARGAHHQDHGDALTAHGTRRATDPAILGATVVNVHVHLGHLDIPVHIGSAPNQDLAQRCAGCPLADPRRLGAQVSKLLTGLVELTTNYQPEGTGAAAAHGIKAAAAKAAAGQDPSVSALHISLAERLAGGGRPGQVTVGPNAATGEVDAFLVLEPADHLRWYRGADRSGLRPSGSGCAGVRGAVA